MAFSAEESRQVLLIFFVKPLENGKVAVCAFNKSGGEKNVKIDLGEISNLGFVNLQKKSKYCVEDVWQEESFVSEGVIDAVVPSHGVKVYIAE